MLDIDGMKKGLAPELLQLLDSLPRDEMAAMNANELRERNPSFAREWRTEIHVRQKGIRPLRLLGFPILANTQDGYWLELRDGRKVVRYLTSLRHRITEIEAVGSALQKTLDNGDGFLMQADLLDGVGA